MASNMLQKVRSALHMNNDDTAAPYGLRWRSNTFFIIATVAAGLFTDLFLYGLVIPILPYMLHDRIGVPPSQIQSHVDLLLVAYAGASVLSSPVAGYVADHTATRQAPFLGGLVALIFATVLLFVGTNVATLVVARLLQGISASIVWTVGLALCLETVGPQHLGKTIGSIFSFISVGSFMAPLVGGVMYAKLGTTAVLGLSLAVLVVDFAMRALVIEKRTASRYQDAASGSEDESSGSTNNNTEQQQDQQNESNEHQDGDEEQQPLLGPKPHQNDDEYFKISPNQPAIARKITILPCLANPRLLTAFLVALVQASLLGSFDATVATTGQELFDLDPFEAGLLFLPLGIFDLILGPLSGWFVDRYGTKAGAVLGYTFLVPVLILLRLPHEGGRDQVMLYSGLLALCGIGLAIIGAPSIVESGAIVRRYHDVNPEFFGEQGPYAQLYGLNSLVFSLGLTIGPALAGELKQVIGYGNMNAVLAGINALTAILSFVWLGGKPKFLSRK